MKDNNRWALGTKPSTVRAAKEYVSEWFKKVKNGPGQASAHGRVINALRHSSPTACQPIPSAPAFIAPRRSDSDTLAVMSNGRYPLGNEAASPEKSKIPVSK